MNPESHEFTRNIVIYIARLERQRRQYLDKHLREQKLYGSMFMIVLFLNRQPGSSQDDLVDFLGVDKSGVARKCRQLEDLGYIRREQSKLDRRQNKLYLTEQGTELVPVIRELLQKWRELVVGDMDELNQKELLQFLEYMMNNAAKAEDQ